MLPCNLRLSPLLRTWATSPPSTPASFAPSPFWAQIEAQACGLLDQPGRNSRETLPESPDPPSKPPGQLPKPYTHIQDSQLHPKLYGNTTTWPRKCHCASQHGTGTSPAPVGAPEPLVPATLCAFLTGQGIISKDSKARPPQPCSPLSFTAAQGCTGLDVGCWEHGGCLSRSGEGTHLSVMLAGCPRSSNR